MRQNNNGNGNNGDGNNGNENNGGGWSTAAVVGGVVGGLAALAGGWYLLSSSKKEEEPAASSSHVSPPRQTPRNSPQSHSNQDTDESESNPISRLFQNFQTRNNTPPNYVNYIPERRGVPRSSAPPNPLLSNLNALLSDLYLRYISLDDDDFELYYGVMQDIFRQIHNKMKDVDPYYQRYSSTVQYAGSHPDGLRINKPDEFDIDIVISLPLNYSHDPFNPEASDIVLEPKDPGFVQLKMGVQYQCLPKRDAHDWHINKTAYEWKDDKNYLLRSKFSDWFKSVVHRALNHFRTGFSDPVIKVGGVPYTITRRTESGPAVTLMIENTQRNFKLDVDLVPALRFPLARWPFCSGYREVPRECQDKNYWMVVPKPNKAGFTPQDKHRSWRVALHEQEAMLMHDTNNLRHAIRLLKKLRDAQNMNKIASYYIKTLFFWEVMERNDRPFWNKNPAYLFKIMVKKFHNALVTGKIPYFWNKNNNLIGAIDRNTLDGYAAKVAKLIEVLEQPSEFKEVARFLLTPSEFQEYNSNFLHLL